MLDWSRPELLLLLLGLPLVRWLHRRGLEAGSVVVPALYLWPAGERPLDAEPRTSPDPRWRLRALIITALLLALAGPRLVESGRRVDVLFDESPTWLVQEAGGTRLELAARQLARAVEERGASEIRLVSLQRRATRSLDPDDAPGWADQLRDFARLEGTLSPPPQLLPPPPLAADRERWLLSDGTRPDRTGWLRRATPDHVIVVGSETENAGVTRLALRPHPAEPRRLLGIVRVGNGGRQVARRRLEILDGARLVTREDLTLAPGEIVQRPFEVPAGKPEAVRAALVPGDAFGADDALAIPLRDAPRLSARIDRRCDEPLHRALRVHPGLALHASGPATLAIWCSDAPPPSGVDRVLRIDALGTRVDAGTAEYAVFVSGLLDRASERSLLDRSVSVGVAHDALSIAPAALAPPDAARPAKRLPTWRDVSMLCIGLAAVLLLIDALQVGASTGAGARAARLALLAFLGVALWNPLLPAGRAPLDVALLVDDSLSVDRQQLARAWQRLSAGVRELPGAGTLQVVRFGSTPVLEQAGTPIGSSAAAGILAAPEPPRRERLDRTGSDLAEALRFGLSRLGADRASAIVLAGDGIPTRGDAGHALEQAHAAGVAVVAVPVASDVAEGDVWIEGLEAPPRARVGEAIRVVARLGTASRGHATLRLRAGSELLAARRVTLAPGPEQAVPVDVTLPLREPGVVRIDAEIESRSDPRPDNDRRHATVELEERSHVLYVASATRNPPLARSLAAGGWEVARVAPAALTASLREPPAFVVLDDVAVPEIADVAHRRLDALVHYEGVGLLVLGGPHSFAAGAYRGSALEALLPVTAEASRPQSRAAVLFLVDTSGSMERDRQQRSRLALAERAVTESLAMLEEEDWIGIFTFAVEAHELRPLGPRASRVRVSLPAASGGTRLAPALREALDRLAAVEADQRLVVLVTDGFAPREERAAVETAARSAGIPIHALAVGVDVDLDTLEALARASGGSVRRVNDVAELPRLMRGAVAGQLESTLPAPVWPRSVDPLPYPFEVDRWPALEGGMVSRARPEASVGLASERGDPLLAWHSLGAGRVAALPAGLGAWARRWVEWSEWGAFTGGLADWLARPVDSPRLHARVTDAPEGLRLEIDALEPGDRWSAQPTAAVSWIAPSGRTGSLALPALAPGHYAAPLPASETGAYRLHVRVGDLTRALQARRTPDREMRSTGEDSRLDRWERTGLLTLWRDGRPPPSGLEPPRERLPTRAPLGAAVLLGFVALLLWEGWGARSVREWRPRPDR